MKKTITKRVYKTYYVGLALIGATMFFLATKQSEVDFTTGGLNVAFNNLWITIAILTLMYWVFIMHHKDNWERVKIDVEVIKKNEEL